MSKLVFACVAVAAFLYAGWLVVFRRPLPDPKRAAGVRRRFFLATLLCAGLMVVTAGKVPVLASIRALAEMKKQVEQLLNEGPERNDWMDPGIEPNLFAVLARAGLIQKKPMILCYSRMAGPVKARSKELRRLQRELLDKSVRAGVLDVEVAAKASVAAASEDEVAYSKDEDVRAYQKEVRRAVRLLYRHGELPSSFVERLERATDVDIIAFNDAKALRNDVQYQLRSLFWEPFGEEVLRMLEARKLIPPARNHRLVMDWYGPGLRPPEEVKRQLAQFEALLDGNGKFDLPGDERILISRSQLPQNDLEYRLAVRRALRALVKTGLVSPDQLRPLEELLGVPIVGRLEGP